MLEHTQVITLVDGTEVTFTLRNTLFQDIRDAQLKAIAEVESAPDANIRGLFCYIASHTARVDGAPDETWFNVESVKLKSQFEALYHRFAKSVNDDAFMTLVAAINAMKMPNNNPVTKPDEALTDDERADPKSKARAARSKNAK